MPPPDMTCGKCGGLFRTEWVGDGTGAFIDQLACVICGNVVDLVIIRHRALQKAGQVPQPKRHPNSRVWRRRPPRG
jgi:hypothetical protein